MTLIAFYKAGLQFVLASSDATLYDNGSSSYPVEIPRKLAMHFSISRLFSSLLVSSRLFSSLLVSSRLFSSLLLLTVLLANTDRSIGRDPPCANLSVAIEEPPIGSVCLDDWIRFNQRLWIDLFWPNAFDMNQPFILVDERLGAWADSDSTTGQNSQGDHITIDVSAPPDLIDFQTLLSDGTINASQYQIIMGTDTSAADVLAVMTNWDAGWQVVMHAWLFSSRQIDGTYLNIIVPYHEWSIKAEQSVDLGIGGCLVQACVCADGTLPGETQNQTYTQNMCARLIANAQQIEEIKEQYRTCKWRKIGLGAGAVATSCLGILCGPAAPAVIGAGVVVGAATALDGLADCKSAYTSALSALANETDLYQQIQCLQACTATQPQP